MRSRARRGDRRPSQDAGPRPCEHLAGDNAEPAAGSPSSCQGCADLGEVTWAHLRRCVACGYVGCCDSSPHQHATEHFRRTGHPVMRSAEPGETWRWCYLDLQVG